MHKSLLFGMITLSGIGLSLLNGASPKHDATSDWPQFMRTSARTGDAADETLTLPLGLVAQVKLDDAVTTSPAIVDGRVYIVDQMGTAYAIDLDTGKLLWKRAPEGKAAFGSNTSSPCVAHGRVYYGTTAGNLHILDAADGTVIRTVALGSSLPGSPTLANGAVYLQDLSAVIHCLDLDGKEKWRWDHYRQYDTPLPERLKNYFPGSYDRPHYGGNEIAVSGKHLVTGLGWDQFCLEDQGDRAKLVWCNRAALGKDDGIPLACSISGGHVYTAWPGVDGAGSLLRVALADGTFDRKKDQWSNAWAILGTPAVRGETVYYGRTVEGVTAREFGKQTLWNSYAESNADDATPTISSPILTKNHCLYTTLNGELIVVDLAARGGDLAKMKPAPFRFRTPHGKPIASTPAVSRGRVCFGCDDGHVYILGPEGKKEPTREELTLHERRSAVRPATGKAYAWPSPNGDQGNTRFVPDPKLKPPFQMRWGVRSFGLFHQPLSATAGDLLSVSLSGLVVCLEQETARIRWRVQLPRQRYDAHGLYCADGRIYLARPQPGGRGAVLCLDEATGKTLWSAACGLNGSGLSKVPPVLAGDRIAFATIQGTPPKTVVQAWDARSGKPAWQVELDIASNRTLRAPTGCALGEVMFFSGGGMTDNDPKDRYPGETVAIDAKTGKVLWRTRAAFTTSYSALMARDERLYVVAYAGPMTCLSARDGSVIWKGGRENEYWQHGAALGPDFLAVKGYGGHATRYRLEDGKPQDIKLGGTEHTCSSVVLTESGLSLVATVGGLYARDMKTGELLWRSERGFAPRNCTNPAVTNGRIFLNPQVNGMLYCFEPKPAE